MSKLSEYAGKGTETVTDVNNAYLKIAQTISDECNKNKPNYIKGLEAGQFFNSVTHKIYGSSMDVIVLATRKNYALLDDANSFKGFSDDIKPEWTRDAAGALRTPEGYKAQLNYGYLVVSLSDIQDVGVKEALAHPMVLTLKRSDVGAARAWNTMLVDAKLDDGKTACPIFGTVWSLSSVYREGDKGSWYGISNGKGGAIKPNGYLQDEYVDDVALASANFISSYKAVGAQNEAKAYLPPSDLE